MAGDVLKQGLVAAKEVFASVMLGSVIFLITSDYLRHSFSTYVLIYPVKLAARLTLVNLLVTAPTQLLIIAVASVIPW